MKIKAYIKGVPKGLMCQTKKGVLCPYYFQRTCNLFRKNINPDTPYKKIIECATSEEVF